MTPRTNPAAGREPKEDEVDPRRRGDPPWRERTAHRSLPVDIVWALREARRAHGWTQRQAADEVSISAGMLQHLERGDRRPSTATADDLVAGLNLPPDVAEDLRAVAIPLVGRSSPYRVRAEYPPGPRETLRGRSPG